MAALPTAPNTTCDVYHSGHSPPAAPDVAAVPIYLSPVANISTLINTLYTHIGMVAVGTDIRDYYGDVVANADNIYVPDKNGTKFIVLLKQRVGRGTRNDYMRIFLQRSKVTWPSDNV